MDAIVRRELRIRVVPSLLAASFVLVWLSTV